MLLTQDGMFCGQMKDPKRQIVDLDVMSLKNLKCESAPELRSLLVNSKQCSDSKNVLIN